MYSASRQCGGYCFQWPVLLSLALLREVCYVSLFCLLLTIKRLPLRADSIYIARHDLTNLRRFITD